MLTTTAGRLVSVIQKKLRSVVRKRGYLGLKLAVALAINSSGEFLGCLGSVFLIVSNDHLCLLDDQLERKVGCCDYFMKIVLLSVLAPHKRNRKTEIRDAKCS